MTLVGGAQIHSNAAVSLELPYPPHTVEWPFCVFVEGRAFRTLPVPEEISCPEFPFDDCVEPCLWVGPFPPSPPSPALSSSTLSVQPNAGETKSISVKFRKSKRSVYHKKSL